MTSTSIPSRSDRVPDALSVGGGASIAAAFFFLVAKKLPKKPALLSDIESSVGLDLPAVAEGGKGFPVLGSTCVGFD